MQVALAERILADAMKVGPRCGQVHVIAIDGPSGSGKTTLAAAVSAAARRRGLSAATLHTDAVCPGWTGLPEVPGILHALLVKLASEGTATYQTWDWRINAPSERATIEATDVLIVEGVGSGSRSCRQYLSARCVLDAPEAERKARALRRDGETFVPHWDAWAAAERAYFTHERSDSA